MSIEGFHTTASVNSYVYAVNGLENTDFCNIFIGKIISFELIIKIQEFLFSVKIKQEYTTNNIIINNWICVVSSKCLRINFFPRSNGRQGIQATRS